MGMENKFRGQRFDTKEWIYGSLLDNDVIVEKGSVVVDEDYIGICGEWSSVIKDTVGQYTGLKDKNGTEIYEGDYIRLDNEIKMAFGVNDGVVIYEAGSFFINEINSLSSLFVLVDYNYILRGNVIGNVHDNPELLQV